MKTLEPRAPVKLRKYIPAVGPGLRKLLLVVLVLFAIMVVNSLYLAGVTAAEWYTGEGYQNYFYQYMFLLHLALGLVLILPVIIFGVLHLRNARGRPNRVAVRMGYALFTACLVLLGTGLLLTRLEGLIEIRSPGVRGAAYWAHVLSPLAIVWLFVLHRLAGPRIKWKAGLGLAGVAVVFAGAMVAFHSQDPRLWGAVGPKSGEKYFFPSLARTGTGNFIPARTLMMDQYCIRCHPDIHENWAHGAHRFSSFNNPAYLFSVRKTREAMLARDGNVQGSRFCAGCHDPVPFFSGAFDDPNFDDENHPTSQSGITCTVCHAISSLNNPRGDEGYTTRGNSDYTIEEPIHYPFAFSKNPFLQWVNEQLVKAKPGFHKKTFLKPLHRTAEFCGACHKVHLPEELNHYKFLRGQNHYDPYLLSGVSGHGASSFYYPKKAVHNCNKCHMPLEESGDFGARYFDDSGKLKVHDHLFPSANTGIAHLLEMPESVVDAHRQFLKDVLRADIFGLRKGGTIEGELLAPLRPEVPALEPGGVYLLETVIRTVKLGHLFTQGTADSNEVWMDVTVSSGGRVIGRSGGLGKDGEVDPWSHFVNAYVLDRKGNRIDRRNPEDIYTVLYSHQIPPGAGDVVHYRLQVPEDVAAPVEVEVKIRYRKFDTTYMKYVRGEEFVNDLPVVTIATDRLVFPVAGRAGGAGNPPSPVAAWERWNDYGIGLLRKGGGGSRKGELRQAEEAFREVERLGRPDGPLNLGRVYFKEGRLDDAVTALRRAAAFDPPAYPWTVAWFTGLVNRQNGNLDDAIENFKSIIETRFEEARRREFDFSLDYRVLNQLALTLFDRSRLERGEKRIETRNLFLQEAARWFEKTLEIDRENVTAHYGLAQVYRQLGNEEKARRHEELHDKYRPDDNSGDAVRLQRARNRAADHAAESIVIFDLQKPENYELSRE